MSDALEALGAASPVAFWLDRPDLMVRREPLRGEVHTDLVIVGGGFSGLWAALQALEESPGRRVAIVEAEHIGYGASGRNGGFCEASLTHGPRNGLVHWPDEMEILERLGAQNFAGFVDSIHRHQIEAHLELNGTLQVATEQWQLDDIVESAIQLRTLGIDSAVLDAAAARAIVDSPTYLGAQLFVDGAGLVDPARLASGLAEAVERLGATIYESSPALAIEASGAQVSLRAPFGRITAARAVVATNAWAGLIRRMRRYIAPVYDYVLMSEPLAESQLAQIGWQGRQGVSDSGNQFHYYRLTVDDRILWGGYDAVYHFGNRIHPRLEQGVTHELLARHFFATFPQLEGLRFTHRWAGPIATTTRFTAAWGTANDRRVAWVGGYTGLGVVASRFGARVALDLVDGRPTERTQLGMVRRPPIPFPPEPARWLGVEITRRAMARADRRQGRRGPWLKVLDRFGIGFDS